MSIVRTCLNACEAMDAAGVPNLGRHIGMTENVFRALVREVFNRDLTYAEELTIADGQSPGYIYGMAIDVVSEQ